MAEAATAAALAEAELAVLVGKSSTLGHILLGGLSIKGSNAEKLEKSGLVPCGPPLGSLDRAATLTAVAMGDP